MSDRNPATPRTRALVVEDESLVQMHLCRILEDLGYEVAGVAATSDEALDLAARHAPDVVLMDVRIPGDRDGIETASELVARHQLPVVFVTAFADDTTVSRLEAAGAAGYVVKPFRPVEIRVALSTALRGHARWHRLERRALSLTSILGTLSDALVAIDRDGGVTYWTTQAALLTGWDEGEALGRGIHDLLPAIRDDDDASLRRVVARSFDAARPQPIVDFGLRMRDGTETRVSGETTPLLDEHGAPEGLVLTLRRTEVDGAARAWRQEPKPSPGDDSPSVPSDPAARPAGAASDRGNAASPSHAASPAPAGRRPTSTGRRVLLYAHDTFGLGHLRRCLNLTQALLRHNRRYAILIATGSPVAHRYPLPEGADYLKLPAVKKVASERYEARSLELPGEDIRRLRTNLLLRTVRDFEPDLLIVDHAPIGMRGEMLPALEWLACHTDCVRILGLRDIVDGAESVVSTWDQQGIYDVLENLYDHVFVYGMRDIFDPVAAYRFPAAVAARTRFASYVTETAESGANHDAFLDALPHPLVTVTIGGGDGAGETVIGTYLEMLRRYQNQVGFWSVLLPGPLLPPALAGRFAAMARGLPVTIRDFVPSITPYVCAADAVVCTGGYNTMAQVLAGAPRALVIPRCLHREEQLLRARRLQALGLVDVLHPDDVDPDRLFAELRRQLADTTAPLADGRARNLIQFEGAARVAEFCGEAVGRALTDAGA